MIVNHSFSSYTERKILFGYGQHIHIAKLTAGRGMAMQGKRTHYLRTCAPIILYTFTLLLVFTPTTFAAPTYRRVAVPTLVGPKTSYLALGDSLAFGYQPDLNWNAGYSSDFFHNLQSHGVKNYNNLACLGETTVTMIKGNCPYALVRQFPYSGSQLTAALNYLKEHAGQVSPVTLDLGANDMMKDINVTNCTISTNWAKDLATMDTNLTKTILPQLVAALTINGQHTGDLLLMNYYDAFQNTCPNSISYVQELNQHLANDAAGLAMLVDVFTPFGGAASPDPSICTLTWMCSTFKDFHTQNVGYSIIATAFEQATGY